jgi:hypothetical protein
MKHIAIMKKIFLQPLLATVIVLLSPSFVNASDITIQPLLLDLELVSREVVTHDITLTNDSDTKLTVYATVNEIAIDGSGDIKEFISPVMTDRTSTVTSWIEITRGRIELEPRETKTVPLTIRMHPQTKPGVYHAFIGFVPDKKRPDAEVTALQGNAEGLILKIALDEVRNELLRISKFQSNRIIFNESRRSIEIEVQNDGDADSIPSGEIIFYNSRGEEVASTPANETGVTVPAGGVATLTATVPFYDELGRFKANVTLKYGPNSKSTTFDTLQFFMIPFKVLLVLGACIALFSLIITYLLRRVFRDELHSEEDGKDIPLYIRNDREHIDKDHDIHVTKK